MLKLFNSLTRKIEEFTPLHPPQVGFYTCGPTVYDYMHIGNLRTFVLSDLLIRVLKQNGYQVKSVRNITDIDDKIIARAKEKSLSIQKLANEYTKAFFADLDKLNILPVDVNPKATEHIGQMVKYIEELIKKGVAYEKDGSVYFDISKFPEYGKLSGLEGRTLKTGTRILSDEYSKDDVQDFALWKAVSPDEGSPSASSGSASWSSPWGKGRPGWHIECSVMSQEYLGETFDLHTGGVDLLFPHHENEIAQAEAKTTKPFVRFFVHGEHMLVEGAKMSKSLNNFYTLKDLEKRGFNPLALRYLFLTAHWRDKLNFTWDSLTAAQNTLNKIREQLRDFDPPEIGCSEFEQKFTEAINNDLNLPQALAVMHDLLGSDYATSAKAKTLLKMDEVLGLGLEKYIGQKIEVPTHVQKLIDQREETRIAGDFNKSDQLRAEIKKLGFEIEDTASGPKIKKV
ncbi:MAG: cysteine--tRNA ligase [Candidatus Daviesbacteria bacterium]|nr:MAG: cysteine--tRNA ligase [Candidatus Daviesbacteria bacterium]